ncbi:MAG TPA: hypothetical protein VN541_01125, partial [Tepidisphaeraceae bacterium]|nr:hypothetical protein [Tepidisphaeraceae bacterium]
MQTLPKMSIYRHEWPPKTRRPAAAPAVEQIPDDPELDVSTESETAPESESWRRWMPVLVSACVSLAVSGAVMWFGLQRFAQQQRQTLAMTQQEE